MQVLMIAGNVGIHELLRCDFSTGEITWRFRTEEMLIRAGRGQALNKLPTWNSRYAGRKGFTCIDGHGYLMGRIFSKAYKAHRVIWALKNGEWPNDQIDHLNGDRTDNRLINLRSVCQSENNQNLKARSDNKSGHVGVCFDQSRKKWLATINTKYIGRFETKCEAIAARQNHPDARQFTERHGN